MKFHRAFSLDAKSKRSEREKKTREYKKSEQKVNYIFRAYFSLFVHNLRIS